MRVLHVITGLNVGGAEAMLARLLERRHLSPDIEPVVASLMPPRFAGPRVKATGAPVHDLGLRSAASGPMALLRLVELVRRLSPDVVMAWMHHAQLAATLACKLSGRRVPVIWNVRHSLNSYASEKPMTRAILRIQARVSRSPAAVVYNARAARKQYEALGFDGAQAAVLPNGFSRAEPVDRVAARERLCGSFGIPPTRLIIGTVARAHPMKDVPNLLAAFAKLLDTGLDAHLLLVGEGMDRCGSKAAAAALGCDRLTLSGQRSDVGNWLAGLDMLVLPSAWGEGFPNVLGEAMLAGVPCVATDVGDARWIVADTGRVVSPRDPGQLAAAMLDLAARGEDGRRALGAAARRRIETRFDLDDVAGRYASLFRAVAADAPWPVSATAIRAETSA